MKDLLPLKKKVFRREMKNFEHFLAKNPNPVLSVGSDGTVLYSNEAGELLLTEWGVVSGEKLPSDIGDFVQRTISQNTPEKMEVKVGRKVYLLSFHPVLDEECVNIYGFDVSDQKEFEGKLHIKETQNDTLYRIGKIALEHEDLQSFLDESVELIASILEIEYCKILELLPDGNFLLRAGFGWKPGLVGKAIVGGEKESQAGYTLLSRIPVVVEDFAEESRFKKPEILKIHQVESGASVKIGSTEKMFGVLGVHSIRKREFTPDDTYFLSSVAFLIAQVIERKKAEEALKQAHDSLEEKIKERTAELEKSYTSLKESERSLAEAQRMAHIGNWSWNFVTGEVCWSAELYRIFGRSPEESGATFDEFLSYVHPDDLDLVSNSIKRGLNGKPVAGDYRIILANGEERIVHTEAEVVFCEENTPAQMKGTVQNITEIKSVEEQIKILANIVESSNDAIGTISLDGIITSWNKGAERVYGYSTEEILGKPVSILAPPNLEMETTNLTERVKDGERIHHYETLRLRKDGTVIYVSITLSPVFDIHGKLAAISFISRDITERKKAAEKLKESEEKYRSIVETANEGICIINAEARVTYANKKMTDMLGYNLRESIGKPIWDFISEESKATVKKNMKRRQQRINESYQVKLVRKDNSPLWVLINAKPLFSDEGEFAGSLCMLTDITRIKEAEEAIANVEIARQKEIHHRIKNNLQVISSLLDLQAEKFKNRECIKDSEVLKAFRESQDRVTSIALIHEELYEGERTDALDLSLYLKKLAENFFQTYRLGNLDISLKTDLKKNIFFDMDTAVPLGMIVNELISNSFKYAFPGRGTGEMQIKLFSEEAEDELNYKDMHTEKDVHTEKNIRYTLIVSDNGIGIPENIDFENPDTLGLQLVNILVCQLDGEIELKRDNGTEFIIMFSVDEKRISKEL